MATSSLKDVIRNVGLKAIPGTYVKPQATSLALKCTGCP